MCTNVDGLECTMLGEVGQAEGRNVAGIHTLPYMWSIERNATNELTYGAETDSLP